MKSKLIITLTALLMLGGISAMARGSFPKGDINEDGVVNAADIVALANIIMNGEEPSGEAKYYWYAGTTLPTADNIASIALGSSNTIERWNGKEFLVTNTGSVATPVYVCTPVDFNVIWKDPNGFDINLPEVTDARFTYNGVEYKVQKKGRDLAAGAEFAVNGYYSDSDATGVSQVPAQAVLIQSEGGLLTVQGLDDGTEVSVYGVNGTEAGAAVSRNGQAQVNTNLSAGSIAIVKIGDKSVKVVIK